MKFFSIVHQVKPRREIATLENPLIGQLGGALGKPNLPSCLALDTYM